MSLNQHIRYCKMYGKLIKSYRIIYNKCFWCQKWEK